MRSFRISAIALFISALVIAFPGHAYAFDSEPTLSESTGACVADSSGNVLFERNGDQEMPMASITKVMTAIVALDSGIPLDQQFSFIQTDFSDGAQLAGYADGDPTTLGELLKVTLIFSGNDAARNVAYMVAGSEEAFVDLMNQKAAELGMTHTHFMNPHGLEEDGHYSCAKDLVVMGRYAMEHYPFIRETVHTPSVNIVVGGSPITLETTDHLMGSYDGLLGIKTGKTESGASFLGSARRNHVTLYSVALCCPTDEGRWDDTRALLDWGFGLYSQKALSHSSWQLRNVPWQDGFWLRSTVSAQRDVTGSVFCEGSLTYTTVMLKPSSMVAAGSVYGTTVWQQEGRHVESVAYQVSKPELNATAWNPFMQPVFEDGGGLAS